MKKIILASLVLATAIQFASCKKINCNTPDKKAECELIPAKIIRYDCDRVIFELLTNEKIGDDNWTDEASGITYHNVASCFNTCQISEITKGNFLMVATLYVKIKQTEEFITNGDCMQCQAISTNVPNKQIDFLEIKTEPCKGETNPTN